MNIIVDLHIHSKYSMATSKYLDLNNISFWADKKGIGIIGTGDFTHPHWMNEIKNMKELDGLLKYKNRSSYFILSVEVNNVFKREDKVYKVHNVILSPSIETAEEINEYLSEYGNLLSDGRPTINLDIIDMIVELKRLNKRIEIFPAHIWTPWYSILGSRYGFETIKNALGKVSTKILAIETGLSSDPIMNWMISEIRELPIISNSDAHGLRSIGREATVLNIKELTYSGVIEAIKEKRIVKTYEYFPQEGKYYYDGHRKCNVCVNPSEFNKLKGKCPVCGKSMTKGVLHRIYERADKPYGFKPKDGRDFMYTIPLEQVIAYVRGKSRNAKSVRDEADRMRYVFKGDFNIYESDQKKLIAFDRDIGKAIISIRENKVEWKAGCDGMYGSFKLNY